MHYIFHFIVYFSFNIIIMFDIMVNFTDICG